MKRRWMDENTSKISFPSSGRWLRCDTAVNVDKEERNLGGPEGLDPSLSSKRTKVAFLQWPLYVKKGVSLD